MKQVPHWAVWANLQRSQLFLLRWVKIKDFWHAQYHSPLIQRFTLLNQWFSFAWYSADIWRRCRSCIYYILVYAFWLAFVQALYLVYIFVFMWYVGILSCIFRHCIWPIRHIFWHFIWHFSDIHSGIPSDILSRTCSGILSGASGNVSHIFLPLVLTSFLASILTVYQQLNITKSDYLQIEYGNQPKM